MLKKFLTVTVLGVVAAGALVAGGCAASAERQPASLSAQPAVAKIYGDQASENHARARGERTGPLHRPQGSGQ